MYDMIVVLRVGRVQVDEKKGLVLRNFDLLRNGTPMSVMLWQQRGADMRTCFEEACERYRFRHGLTADNAPLFWEKSQVTPALLKQKGIFSRT